MLRLPRFRMEMPASVSEAARMLRELGAAEQDPARDGTPGLRVMLVAGGTDLYPNMKRRQFAPEVLVSLRRALPRHIGNGEPRPPRRGATSTSGNEAWKASHPVIRPEPDATGWPRRMRDGREGAAPPREREAASPPGPVEFRIGAGATLTAVSEDPVVRTRYAALATAAGLVSTPQLRNMGTIGGNVCLDTRCNWYNESLFWRTAEGYCMKTHPAVVCRVAPSSPRCLAVSSADTVPALIALDARVRIASADGQREVGVAELYREDGIGHIDVRRDEIVTEIVLPPADGWRSAYLKLRDRGSFDFPIVGVAAAVRMHADHVTDARVALTAVGSRPILVEAAGAALVGSTLDDETIAEAADAAHKAARPMDNTSGTIAQRKKTVPVFVARALRALREAA